MYMDLASKQMIVSLQNNGDNWKQNDKQETEIKKIEQDCFNYVLKMFIISQQFACVVSQRSLQIIRFSEHSDHWQMNCIKISDIMKQFDGYDQFETMPQILGEKNCVYSSTTKKIFLLLTSNKNKYLVSVELDYNALIQQSTFKLNNAQILYNFKHQPRKYSLQLSPFLYYMQQSNTLILNRKFHSQSLVIAFKQRQNELKKQFKFQIFWEFYINQDCLSLLDQERLMVNYRQIINKNYVDLQIINIQLKQIRNIRLFQGVQPFCITNIQKISNEDEKVIKIRLYTVLKFSQGTNILEYNFSNESLMNKMFVNKFTIEMVSTLHPTKGYFICQYMSKNNVAFVLMNSCQIDSNWEKKLQEQSKHFYQCDQFSYQSEVWNLDVGILLQFGYLPNKQQLKLKISKIIDKKLLFLHLLNQLQNSSCQQEQIEKMDELNNKNTNSVLLGDLNMVQSIYEML